MSIKLAVPEKNVVQLKPRISVIGVGGGGGNAVNNMIEKTAVTKKVSACFKSLFITDHPPRLQ